jgi:thioredoxin-like negative regulator of GroEL
LEPQIDALQARYPGKVTVQKINDDDPANAALVDQYRVIVVPTTILVHNGVVVQTWPERLSNTSPISAQIDSLLQAG